MSDVLDRSGLRSDPRLGAMPDADLATLYGCSRQYVSQVRSERGILRHVPPPREVPAAPARPAAVPEPERRRLLVALAISERTRADVAAALGWSVSQLGRKLSAPVDPTPLDGESAEDTAARLVREREGYRPLFPADVLQIGNAIGPSHVRRATLFVPGDEAVLFYLLAATDHPPLTRAWDDLVTRYTGATVTRLYTLGLVSYAGEGGAITLTPSGRRAAVA